MSSKEKYLVTDADKARENAKRKEQGRANVVIEVRGSDGKMRRINPWAKLPKPSVDIPSILKKGF